MPHGDIIRGILPRADRSLIGAFVSARLEPAGRVSEGVALFRRIGATAEVRRNTEVTGLVPRHRGESTLRAREREIAGLVAAGRPTRAIAELLVISERTVETHIAAVYRKLGVSNRRALETLLAETSASQTT